MRHPNSDIANYRHGLCGTRLYKAWTNMRSRCYNEKRWDYPYYGGRGIKVCLGLYESAANLRAVVGDVPPKTSLNRIDNNLHYSCGECTECHKYHWPLNIEWASKSVQMRNTRGNRKLTLNGVTKSMIDWAEILKIDYDKIRLRLSRGWSDEDALSINDFRKVSR